MRVLTDAGSVPRIMIGGAERDAVIAKQPRPRRFAPQAHAADASLEVRRAALAVGAALCGGKTQERTFLFPTVILF